MRRLAATVLGLGISLGVLLLMVLQRHVAEIDDGEGRRASETNAKSRVGTLVSLFFVLALAGCKTVSTLDVGSHADAAIAAQIETHETKSEGPEHIIMTVEEFSQLCDPKETAQPEGSAASHVSQPAKTNTISQGQLIRKTVTVTDRGPSLDDLRTISSLQSKLNTATEIKTKDESKPGGIFSLWFLVGLLPLAAGVLIWRLKPSLFGVAWGAVKGLLK